MQCIHSILQRNAQRLKRSLKVASSPSSLRPQTVSSHLEGGDRWHVHWLPVSTAIVGDLGSDLARAATGSSLTPWSQLAVVSLQFHEDVGGVVVLVALRVILGVREATWILKLGRSHAWSLLVPSWAWKAGGEVASLLLWRHVFVVADVLDCQVLAGVEDGCGDLTVACWAVGLLAGGAGHGEECKGSRVPLRVRLVRSRDQWASEVSGEVLLRSRFEGSVSVWVTWWSGNAGKLVLLMLLS